VADHRPITDPLRTALRGPSGAASGVAGVASPAPASTAAFVGSPISKLDAPEITLHAMIEAELMRTLDVDGGQSA
jgi:hypothetical protein